MGLDQYAYVADRAGQRREFYEGGTWDETSRDYVNPLVTKPLEISYWRKHPNLQGWMEKLWIQKGYPGLPAGSNKFDHYFNGVELELTWEDIDRLEQDLLSESVSELGTAGFFFGDPSDDHYRNHDIEFIRKARHHLFLKHKVFYNSSW